MKTSSKFLIIPAFLGAAVAANAATQVVSDSISFSWAETLDGTNTLTVDQFDPALGTLDKVELSVSYTVPVQTLQMDNDTDGTATGNYGFGEFGADDFTKDFRTTDTLGAERIDLSTFSYATQTTSVNLAADTGTEGTNTLDLQGEADDLTYNTTLTNLGAAKYEVLNLFGIYDDYTGTGSISMDLAKQYGITNDVTSTGAGSVRAEQVLVTGIFAMEVTYTYTPVPEPSTYAALFGLAALGLVAVRRRR